MTDHAMERAILAGLRQDLEARTEWDERPDVLVMVLKGGALTMTPFLLPPAIWNTGRPADILGAIAQAILPGSERLRLLVPAGFCGVAFRCEQWVVIQDPDEYADQDPGLARAISEHRLYQRPERIEMRGLSAVDVHGMTYLASLRRGETEADGFTTDRRGSTGTIPEALDVLVMAFTGRLLTPRLDPADIYAKTMEWSDRKRRTAP